MDDNETIKYFISGKKDDFFLVLNCPVRLNTYLIEHLQQI